MEAACKADLALKEELERRGVRVLLTRTADVLIDLQERARVCAGHCDLFVSVHVNSVPRRRGYEHAAGFETYFLNEARTAEAQRVAAMENEALRYDTGYDASRDNIGASLIVEPRFLPSSRLGRVGGVSVPPAGALGLE